MYKTPSEDEKIIDYLTTAIENKRTCLAVYTAYSRGGVCRLTFNPLRLFELKGGRYFFAELLPNRIIHTLDAGKIEGLIITEDNFEYPTHFVPEDLWEEGIAAALEDAFEVKIWFHRSQAHTIRKRVWSKNQLIEELNDGSLVLILRTYDLTGLTRWVLSFGHNAKVLEPAELRRCIKEEAQFLCTLYTNGT